MDTRAVAFSHHTPLPRKPVRRAARPADAGETTQATRFGPFHGGLSYDGLGAINAARLTSQHGSDDQTSLHLNATAAEAYRRSQSAI